MGKSWDAALPARAIWAEVLRVLKPGASCFVCAGSRQDTILGLLTDLREVGFDIQHAALSWVYFNGMPKSTNVSKDFDKAAFLAWLRDTPEGETETRQELMGWGAADVRKAASAAVNGCYSETPDCTGKQVGKPPKAGDRDDLLRYGGDNERPWATGGRGTGTLLLAALQARFGDAPGVRAKVGVSSDSANRSAGSMATGNHNPTGYNIHPEGERTITAPATPEAIEWDQWHSGSVPLKPASEQILWVTKPAEPGPARDNVRKWGVGACNIGECRVPYIDGEYERVTTERYSGRQYSHGSTYEDEALSIHGSTTPSGRYPSNLLVTARALGDDSRYGDLDAWARERGLSDEWPDAALSAGVLRVQKPSRSEKNAGCDDRNVHATVKPVTLFAFLCTLACPRGGVVLDPFGGSGTTGVAAITCGMHWVLCEREAEYVAIAEARTEHAQQVSLQLQEAAE